MNLPGRGSRFAFIPFLSPLKQARIEQLIGQWSDNGVKSFTMKLPIPCNKLKETNV